MPGMVGGFGNFFVPLLIGACHYLNSFFYRKIYNNLISNILKQRNNFNNKLNQIKNISLHSHKKQSLYLNAYLAGLFEGDGYIVISKKKKTNQNVVIGITFNIKDLPLCEYLKNIIEDGWIRIKNKENACVLIFYTDKSIIKFVSLINGYLRSPKLSKFNLIIDYLNVKYSLNLTKYNIDISDIKNNNWFAGFVDADGGFYIRYTDKKKVRIGCELRIEQRMIDPSSGLSYESLFLKIAELLGTKLEISKHNDKSYYLVRGNNRKSLSLILNYFSFFSLYSSKYLDYHNWSQTAQLLLENKAYSVENKKIIYELKHSMNNKRIMFDWSHLNNLK